MSFLSISSHNTLCPAFSYGRPSAKFVHSNYSFFFGKCFGIWSPFILIFTRSLVQFFLSSWCKDPRLCTWGFLHLFGPNVSRVGGERGLVHTLWFFSGFKKGSTIFFPSTLDFLLLLPLHFCFPSPAALADHLHSSSYYGFSHLRFFFNCSFLSKVQERCMQLGWGSSLWKRGRGFVACSWPVLGKSKGHPLSLSLLVFIPPLKQGGLFGTGLSVFLFLFWFL